MAYSDCANNAEIGQFDLILDQTIHGNVVAPQATSVEKKSSLVYSGRLHI